MAQYHTHDTHDHGTSTVVAEDSSSSSVFLAVIGIVLIGFLIWLFAFSGMVFDRDSTTVIPPGQTNIETNQEQQQPPADDGAGVQQQPAPGSS